MNWNPPNDSILPNESCFRTVPFLIQQVIHQGCGRLCISNYDYSDIDVMRPDDHNTVAIFHVKPKKWIQENT